MSSQKVWINKDMNDHRWAFVYSCKRMGDYVVVEIYGDNPKGRADILVDTDPSPVLEGTMRVRVGVDKALRESYLARPL